MNNPLRFAGETFYQSGYHRDPMTQIEGTTLQVVTNTGWMIPYVSCMIVAIGMLSHFLITLSRFLSKPDAPSMNFVGGRGALICGVSAFVLCAIAVLMMFSRPASPKVKDGEFDLEAFGSIPVVADGRTKPLDTVARSSLLVISSGKQTFSDHNDKSQPAIRWLLDVMAKPEVCFKHQVFPHRESGSTAVAGAGMARTVPLCAGRILPKAGSPDRTGRTGPQAGQSERQRLSGEDSRT